MIVVVVVVNPTEMVFIVVRRHVQMCFERSGPREVLGLSSDVEMRGVSAAAASQWSVVGGLNCDMRESKYRVWIAVRPGHAVGFDR